MQKLVHLAWFAAQKLHKQEGEGPTEILDTSRAGYGKTKHHLSQFAQRIDPLSPWFKITVSTRHAPKVRARNEIHEVTSKTAESVTSSVRV